MKKLIGIAGKAHSGKDTVATHLWERYGFTRIAFADPVKLAAQHAFGLTNPQTWDAALKEVVIPYWGMSPRRIFQLLSTEATQPIFGQDIWVKRWLLTYNMLAESDDIVVTDVRHEHEADKLRELGGIIIHLTRPGLAGVESHSSENGIEFKLGDTMLHNDGTLEDLFEAVDTIVEGLPE